MKDYYQILNIKFDSDIEIIKKAYRRLALLYHPDINHLPDAPEKFIEITEAYEVLRDNSSRNKYNEIYLLQKKKIPEKYDDFFDKWYQQGYNKAKQDAQKKYSDFKESLSDLTFHASHYTKIGCTGGVIIFLGISWIFAPIVMLVTVRGDEIIGISIFSFILGIITLIVGINKTSEMNQEYRQEKAQRKTKI